MKQIDESYRRQATAELQMGLPSCYSEPDSVDNWRHVRMLDATLPIRKSFPNSEWLTIGDGRFGSDAAYLFKHGVSDVTASSLTDEKLKIAYERGYIPAFRAENAEHISVGDDSVDFVLCKESYHHFPRPPIALYEMLRVARIAVVLIEPFDNPKVLDGLKKIAKRVLRGDRGVEFEPSGNFLYKVDARELGKLMSAIGGEAIAVKGINDFFHPRVGGYPANKINIGSLVTRLGVAVQDALSKTGLLGYGLGCFIVFKPGTDARHIAALRNSGFRFIDLPRNPYA